MNLMLHFIDLVMIEWKNPVLHLSTSQLQHLLYVLMNLFKSMNLNELTFIIRPSYTYAATQHQPRLRQPRWLPGGAAAGAQGGRGAVLQPRADDGHAGAWDLYCQAARPQAYRPGGQSARQSGIRPSPAQYETLAFFLYICVFEMVCHWLCRRVGGAIFRGARLWYATMQSESRQIWVFW